MIDESAPVHLEARAVSRRFESPAAWGEHVAGWLGMGAARSVVRAVDTADLQVRRGEVLGLVGESGCGKSTLGRMMAGILPPTAGEIVLDGRPVMSPGPHGRKTTSRVQMIFQDPFASLDPRMRVGQALAEGPLTHRLVTSGEAAAYVEQWLLRVGLPAQAAQRYPHQFSGGQRQRIAIARALAMQPDTLICDEPVASLDVSIQAQVLNLFLQLKAELSLTMVFISHHLGVVRHLCDRVAVMYLGRIVEVAPAQELYARPRHPYTRALLDSVPRLDLGSESAVIALPVPIQGELPSPLAPPPGCHFHLRCPRADARCRSDVPATDAVSAQHRVACHRWRES
ncbi:MAG: ABC transporter ATP-binding protein [Rubrivivax sp.]